MTATPVATEATRSVATSTGRRKVVEAFYD